MLRRSFTFLASLAMLFAAPTAASASGIDDVLDENTTHGEQVCLYVQGLD